MKSEYSSTETEWSYQFPLFYPRDDTHGVLNLYQIKNAGSNGNTAYGALYFKFNIFYMNTGPVLSNTG